MNKNGEIRAVPSGFELRDEGREMPTLVGNLAVFNEWAEIRSSREGHFLERMAPGAFTKTIQENADRMRVLFNHGQDVTAGEKPLGPIRSLEADEAGVHYEVELLDTSYNRDLIPGLERGLYGSSFRFEVLREDFDRKAGKSSHNPKGLPERTVTEVRMSEFGPVTFPAYTGAKSGIRSLTDEFCDGVVFNGRYSSEDSSTEADLPEEGEQEGDIAPANDRAGESHSVDASRDQTPDAEADGIEPEENAPPSEGAERKAHPTRGRRVPLYTTDRKEKPSWLLQ